MSSSTAPIESLDLKGQPRLDADITKDKRFQGKVDSSNADNYNKLYKMCIGRAYHKY